MLLAVVFTAVLANAGAVFAARSSGSISSSYHVQNDKKMSEDRSYGWRVSSIAEDYTMYASYAAVFCGDQTVSGVRVTVGMGKAEALSDHVALARGYYAYSFKKWFRAREQAMVYCTAPKWEDLALYNIPKWADFRARANVVEMVYDNYGRLRGYRNLTTDHPASI